MDDPRGRERSMIPALEAIAADIRLAVRFLRSRPGFTIMAVLTMALGMGAAAAVFSVVDPILFREPAYENAAQLVSVGMVAPIERDEFLLGADYFEWRQARLPFRSMTTWSGVTECDLGGDRPKRLNCARTEANFLEVLGVRPQIGRWIRPEEDRPEAGHVVLLSDALWRSAFGADTEVTGRSIVLDGTRATIAGVLPKDFELPNFAAFDMIVPQALNPAGQRRPNTGAVLRAFARLHDGVSPELARQQLRPLFEASLQWVPAPFRKDVGLRVQSLKEKQTREVRFASRLLLLTVLMVALAACANLTSLLLIRGSARAREFAIRTALGARKGQLVRLVLIESLLISLAGAGMGCACAAVSLRAWRSFAPEGQFRVAQAVVDGRVLTVMLVLAIFCGLIAGVLPSLRAGSLRGERRSTLRWPVVAQVAASVSLLALAAVFGAGFLRMRATPMGLDARRVVVARITLPRAYEDASQRRTFFDRLEERLERSPLGPAALSDTLPPAGPARTMIYSLVEIEGRPRPGGEGTGGMVVWREVTPSFFQVLGVPILEGRGFHGDDQMPGRDVMIVSRTLARRLVPGGSILGARVRVGRAGPWRTVIGVSADVRNAGLAPGQDPEYYLPRPHAVAGAAEPSGRPPEAQRSAWIILKTPFPDVQASAWIENEVHALDTSLPVEVESLQTRIGSLSSRERFQAIAMSVLGALALCLACLGIVGSAGFLVLRRQAEFGIRLALGATPAQLSRLMLRTAMNWVLWGLPLGLAGAWVLTRVARSASPFMAEGGLPAAGLAAATVACAGLLAAWSQARLAARIEPARVLRLNEER